MSLPGVSKQRQVEMCVQIEKMTARAGAIPFDINTSIVHLLHRAGQCTGEKFVAQLSHRELTPRQFAVMSAVAARESATQITITDDTGIDRSTMVDVVRRLIKRGLLQRRRSRTDARSYVVRLTDAGRQVFDAAAGEAIDVDRAILSTLAKPEREVLVRHLVALVRSLE
jgi:DNA-binding MarR family transcriptional regulator